MDKLAGQLTRFFEVVPFLSFVGTLCLLLGGIGGATIGAYSIPLMGAYYRVTFITIGALFLLIGYLAHRRGANPPSLTKAGVTLEYPSNSDVVDRTDVRGNFRALPSGYKLQVLRFKESGEFLPTPGTFVVDQKNNTWRMTNVDVGGSTGEKRILKVCLVGPDSDAMLNHHLVSHEIFKKVRALAAVRQGFQPWLPHFTRVPADIIVCGEVTVIRKQKSAVAPQEIFQDAQLTTLEKTDRR